MPLLYKFSRPYAFVGIDFAALGLFLFLIALMSGGMGWYLRLIIPLLLLSGITFILIMLSLRRLEWPWLYRIALACLAFGLFLPGVETLIRWNAGFDMGFEWSFYAAIPIAVAAIASFVRACGHVLWEWIPLAAGWTWSGLRRGRRFELFEAPVTERPAAGG